MSRLVLRLFGPPRVELNGKPVTPERRKAFALLIYLSINDLAYSRESLAALLWPEHDASHALAYLRRTLWEISAAIGDDWLQVDRENIGLRAAARQNLWIDVNQFRSLIARSRELNSDLACIPVLTEALSLYTADFLAGFSLKDTLPFDDWVLLQAEALHRELLTALARLAHIHRNLGQSQEALTVAQRWASHDPLDEAAHALVMELYAQDGQFGAALKQYDACARALQQELHVTPSAEMETLHAEIRATAAQSKTGALSPNGKMPSASRSRLQTSTYATPFIGRAAELAELSQLLHDPVVRLITLVGPGGVGKTRLAVEAGRRHSAAFLHGASFVPLAAVAHLDHALSALIDKAGFAGGDSAGEQRSQRQQLYDFLADRQQLLILDNLEHLLATSQAASAITSLLTDLLAAAPHVKILATSHERLNLQEEWVLALEGLPAPGDDLGDMEQYGAVQLFVQNARKATASFQLTAADRLAVVRICQLLGGLPLGLELAAAWTKMLSCQEIAQEIERNTDFLRTPLRNVIHRHQSLRATFEYSWRLLADTEQAAFMQLAVFSGGFRREAALAVAGAPLPILTTLADKSLIYRQASSVDRFNIHPALKPFAVGKLGGDPALQAGATARHGRYYAGFMQQRLAALHGQGQRQALTEIGDEIDNVRLGWEWVIAEGDEADVQAYLEGLFRYYDIRGRFHDADASFARAINTWQQRAGADNITYGLLLACHGWFLNRLSRIGPAHQRVSESLQVLRRLNAEPQLMFVNTLALYVVPLPHSVEVARIARDSLAFFQAHNDRWGMAQVLPFVARTGSLGDLTEALRLHEEALRIHRETGDAVGMANALGSMGELLHQSGDYAGAQRCHQASLEIARELNDRRAESLSLDYLGFIAREMGELARARTLHQESLALSRDLGDQLGVAGSLDNLGLVACDEGDHDEALRLFREALVLRRQSGQTGAIALALEHVGTAALALGDLALAEASLQESLALYEHDPGWTLSSRVHNRLGDLARALGDLDTATRHYRQAFAYAWQHKILAIALESILLAAQVQALQGNIAEAIALAALVQQHSASEFAVRRAAQQLLQERGGSLSQVDYTSAVARGQSLSLDEVAERI